MNTNNINDKKNDNKKSILKIEDKISIDVAANEIIDLVEIHTFNRITIEEVEKSYRQVLMAIQKGLLVINDGKPVYTLLQSIGKENVTDKVEFRTRIKPTDLARITKGINVQDQPMKFGIQCYCYLTSLEIGVLDKLSKFDYKVVEQISGIFL